MISSATSFAIGSAIGSGSLWIMTQHSRVTTFIGAGGKTTCLRSLTQEINSAGLQVVATTTTKVYPEEHMIAWRNINPPPQQKGACFWYDKVQNESGKWIGPLVTTIDDAIAEDFLSFKCRSNQTEEQREKACASSRTDLELPDSDSDSNKRYWVIEGDGARGRKIKCWESYEPQIPRYTECAVLVLDYGLWGNVLQADQVHRPHQCRDLVGQVWKAESAWSYFLRSPVFAPQYGQMSWVILFNSPGNENKDVIDPMISLDLLRELGFKWVEIQERSVAVETRPRHLRLAAGDAKEGDLRWFDLW